jgi:hypothetical protein
VAAEVLAVDLIETPIAGDDWTHDEGLDLRFHLQRAPV